MISNITLRAIMIIFVILGPEIQGAEERFWEKAIVLLGPIPFALHL